jgi:4,5-DOPA dioxygenase extradiol
MSAHAENVPDVRATGRSRMPVLFVGHGSPMNAIEDNVFAQRWKSVAESLPKPKAILCISAHWETQGTLVTAMDRPRTIHDFGGFPEELFNVQYPAHGSPWLAKEAKESITHAAAGYDKEWGLDHGCWSVMKRMFPRADVPIVQLSLDYTKEAGDHYGIGKDLVRLRYENVLIVGSGNMVHNLRRVVLKGNDFNEPFGLDWAMEANALFKKLINEDRHDELIDYHLLGSSVQLAIPTAEHYLPMLYVLAAKEENDSISFFNDQPVAGSLTMTSFVLK